MSAREILERVRDEMRERDVNGWPNAIDEALAALEAEGVQEVLSGSKRTISPGGGMEQRPDWRPYLQESSAELIVLPRAAVEALRDDFIEWAHFSEEDAFALTVQARFDALLAAAKGVVDGGTLRAVPATTGGGLSKTLMKYTPKAGTYRVLLIAADAAEEE